MGHGEDKAGPLTGFTAELLTRLLLKLHSAALAVAIVANLHLPNMDKQVESGRGCGAALRLALSPANQSFI